MENAKRMFCEKGSSELVGHFGRTFLARNIAGSLGHFWYIYLTTGIILVHHQDQTFVEVEMVDSAGNFGETISRMGILDPIDHPE